MSASQFLSPIPQPPHDPTSLLLNARQGWEAAATGLQGVELSAAGELTLAVDPKSLRSLTEPSGSFGGLRPPLNVALGPDGMIYLLDLAGLQLKVFDPCACAFVAVRCFSGRGSAPRQLDAPHGIGVCNGNLFVCDTGNHRLGVFTLRGFGLRGYRAPPASAGLTNPWEPFAVAFDGRGRAYVTDGANGCIHRFSPMGTWEKCLVGFGKVTAIAVDCRDRLLVVVEGVEGTVLVVDREGNVETTMDRVSRVVGCLPALPFEVDPAGRLSLEATCPDATAGSSGRPTGPRRCAFDLRGNPLPPGAAPALSPPIKYHTNGTYTSLALNSELYRCQWHRVILRGQVPSGTSVVVSTFTSEVEQDFGQIQALPNDLWETKQTAYGVAGAWDCLVRSGGGRYLWLRLELSGSGTASPTLQSVEIEFPRVSLRRYLPAVFGEEPASADFTDRFLALFDTTLRGIEHEIDTLASYFDPLSAPSRRDPRTGLDFLSWLGTWIGVSVDRQWPEAKWRLFLKQAGSLFDLRGTPTGLYRQLAFFLDMDPAGGCCAGGASKTRCSPLAANCALPAEELCAWSPPPLILEHYQLRRWLFLDSGRLGDEAVVWGKGIVNRSQLDAGAQAGQTQLKSTPDPLRDPFHVYAHKYSVFIPARWGCTDQGRKAIDNLLRSASPAHTQAQVEYVEPRFRIGVQSMIGLDAVIARLPQGVTLGESPLGTASVLTGPPPASGPSLAIGKQSRIGTTTRLD